MPAHGTTTHAASPTSSTGESSLHRGAYERALGSASVAPVTDLCRAESLPALPALTALFRELNRRGIRYCHWKSNIRLEKSLQGRTDLDLLVDRKDIPAFRQLLHAHGVKLALAAPGRDYPAVENHLGFDPSTGRLFHLHVHYQLVLGEQFVKNYRLPLESHFLNSVHLSQEVKIPSPELEIAVLSLRALLKYRARDFVRDVFSIRSSGLPADILHEIKSLLCETSVERIAQVLPRLAEVIPADVVLEFLQTVVRRPRAGFTFYRLRRRLRRALRPHQRHSRVAASARYLCELWRRRTRFRFAPQKKMSMPAGGVTLALIGADGAGKSTVCQLLVQWLSWKLDVRRYYLGSKQPSRLSTSLYVAYRALRRSHRAVAEMLGDASLLSRGAGLVRDTFLGLHHLSIGYDRYFRYRAGARRALGGSIVIFDRCPLDSIPLGPGLRLMDGPQISSLLEGRTSTVLRALAKAEQRLYRKIRPPEFLFVLEVSPEVSFQRKPDHQPAVLQAKSSAISALASRASEGAARLNLSTIDANRPLDGVMSQLKSKVWELL